MASIRKELVIKAAPAAIWDAARDVGQIHKRLVAGFLTDCRMDGPDARIVTFANGMTARELIVDVNDADRRVAWTVVGGRLSHHNGSLQVFAEGTGSRVVWIADLLPNTFAESVAGMMEHGMAAMKTTLESAAAAR